MMNRRESLRIIAIGSAGAGALVAGCNTGDKKQQVEVPKTDLIGHTPEEVERDRLLHSQTFFTPEEMQTIAVLSDWIIPADDRSGSASEAGVPAFIEFMAKDQPDLQTPLRGGLRWMDMKAFKMFEKSFTGASREQQKELLDLIAWPEDVLPENQQGAVFFTRFRNMVATGFFTSKMGIEDLGYMGNKPNEWDGVPEDVLKQYGVAYDEQTLKECLKIEDRSKIMEWPA